MLSYVRLDLVRLGSPYGTYLIELLQLYSTTRLHVTE
jgi:hypothetical protein